MGLKIIEYDECYHDTPSFREKLQAYEKEIENTSESIKGMVKEVKKLITATKEYSKAQTNFADALEGFKLEHIGELSQKELTILESLKEFSRYIRSIEEQRNCLLDNIGIRVADGLDRFRKSTLSPLKEEKRQFERTTDQYYKLMENHMALTTKKKEQVCLSYKLYVMCTSLEYQSFKITCVDIRFLFWDFFVKFDHSHNFASTYAPII